MTSVPIFIPMLLVHVILLTLVVGYPPRISTKPKVFVIGLSKTGTTSMGDALAQLNYTRSGWTDIYSRYLVHQALLPTPNLRPIIAMSERYSALEDLPWCFPHVYENMSQIYPDAKFILTLRRSDQVWLKSMRRHAKSKVWEGHKQVYGAYEVDGNEQMFLKTYNDHARNVREFFGLDEMKGRGMEISIDDPNESDARKWERLVQFLGLNVPGGLKTLGRFPKSNSGGLWLNRDPIGVVWAEYQLMFWVERGMVGFVDYMGWLTALMA